MSSKTCNQCGVEKPLSEYSFRPDSVDGLRQVCKPCMSEGHRLRKYGIDHKSYHALVDSQQGKCAICHEDKLLVVDHDHTTGHIRGLLCHSCNMGLGLFHDDLDKVRAAEGYLLHNK